MKNYIKDMITGIIIGVVLCSFCVFVVDWNSATGTIEINTNKYYTE